MMPPVPPFYSGTEFIMICAVMISSEVDKDIELITTVSYERDGTTIFNGPRITFSDLQNMGLLNGVISYQSSVTISPLVQAYDTGRWTCQVNMSSEMPFIIPSFFSTEYEIKEEPEISGKKTNDT